MPACLGLRAASSTTTKSTELYPAHPKTPEFVNTRSSRPRITGYWTICSTPRPWGRGWRSNVTYFDGGMRSATLPRPLLKSSRPPPATCGPTYPCNPSCRHNRFRWVHTYAPDRGGSKEKGLCSSAAIDNIRRLAQFQGQ